MISECKSPETFFGNFLHLTGGCLGSFPEMFEFLDHTADVAVRLTSRDEEELFRDAAGAVVAILLELKSSEGLAARASLPLRPEAGGPDTRRYRRP